VQVRVQSSFEPLGIGVARNPTCLRNLIVPWVNSTKARQLSRLSCAYFSE
jgi:hypothetical protein